MKVIAVIPARWASTRFEGKVLADIAGKPMIQYVWQQVNKSEKIDDVIIACDDERIVNAAKGFGANVVLTSKEHKSGTDRILEAVKDIDADIIINVQGDEPLIDPEVIDSLVGVFENDADCNVATVIKEIKEDTDITDSNVVKVVVDLKGNALYFSRAAIPFNRDGNKTKFLKHLGIYAYKKDFLTHYADLPSSRLENMEKLEQLRILEAGYKIKTVITAKDSIGVDTKEDLARVEAIIRGK